VSQEVAAIYTGILEQVVHLEKLKKVLSKQILTCRDKKRQMKLIHKFLGYDLNKHKLFEQAAVIAINNREKYIVDHLEALYQPYGNGELINLIRQEIGYTRRFMQVMEKAAAHMNLVSFAERRMIQEVSKYVLAQCRIYMQLDM
jgi:hypothetical protein